MRKFTNYSLCCTKRAYKNFNEYCGEDELTLERGRNSNTCHIININILCSSNKCVSFTWKCSLRWSKKLTGFSKKETSQKETVHMTPNKTFNTSAEKWKNMEHILMECRKERACDDLWELILVQPYTEQRRGWKRVKSYQMEPSEWAQRDANLLHLPQVFCVSGNGPPVHQLLVPPPNSFVASPSHNLHLSPFTASAGAF